VVLVEPLEAQEVVVLMLLEELVVVVLLQVSFPVP
jgi:hypothetical protein